METLRQREIVSHSSGGQNNKPVSFSNVLGLKKYVFLLLVWVFVLGQVQITKAQRVNFQTSPYAADKLINSEDIMIGFEEGETWVKVIVNLVKPAELLAATDWDSRASLNALHAEVLTRQEDVLSTLSHNEFSLRNRFENQPAFSGEITLDGLDKLLNNPRVESIEPVYIEQITLAQGIPLINGMVYRSTYNGTGVAIAITDTGIDYTHPKLGGGGFPNSKVIGGYDFGDDDSDPKPNGQGHGTCCAGIAAGDLGSTGSYIGGVACNAKIYALKVTLGTGGSAYQSDIIKAWDWCISHKNDDPAHPILVISHSMGIGRYYSACDSSQSAYATVANNAAAAGITILSSSGNDGYCDSIGSPPCLSNVISVGAVYDAAFGTYRPCIAEETCATKYSSSECKSGWYSSDNTAPDMVGSFSNTASFLDMLAPSKAAYTTDITGPEGYSTGDYYSSFSGTSAACPYAAGAVACLQSAAKAISGSYLSPSQIRDILTLTGDDITDGKVAITKPRINLGQAIHSIVPQVCCPITISSFPYAEGFEADFGYWVNADGDDTDWTRRTGSTPSSGTGPSSAYEGSYYLYIESSDPYYPNKIAVLDGPCFNLSSLGDPQLRFWYHMYGTSMGVLTVKVSDDNCASWNTVWILSGNQGNDWYEAVVDLSAYSGSKIKIQFVGSTGSSYTSDMAIDDVHLEDYASQPPVAEDGNVVTQVDTPITIALNATDDGYPDPPGILTYIVTSLPSDGTLSDPFAGNINSVPYTLVNNGNQVVYTPDSGYTGTDSFQFKANDGGVPPDGGDSNVATVSMEVRYSTTEYQVGSRYDDTYAWGSTSQDSTTAYLKVGYRSDYGLPYYTSGVRFTNVNIPKGATIISAYLKIQSYTSNLTSSVYGNIQAEATDDADGFLGRYLAGLAKTSASVNWDHTTSWSSSTWYTSPNIAGVVQEVIDRSGWSANNSLAIFYSARTASGGYRYFSSFDRGSSYAPKLEITYTTVPQPTISGRVTYQGSGLAGVSMGGLGVVTDADGYYSSVVPNGWSGTITPSKLGYNFSPPSISYSNVTSDKVNQDYTAIPPAPTISGYVKTSGSSSISGVTMTGWPGTDPVTNSDGYYSGTVSYGWSGTITPSKLDYDFSPSSRSYSNVTSDKSNEDYTAIPTTPTISGYVRTSGGSGISGVTMTGWPGTAPVTDGTGYYSGTVSYDWSGTITPNKSGYNFSPPSKSYSNVTSDKSNEDYTGESVPIVPQSAPYSQDFSSGKPGPSDGWEYYSNNEGRIEVVSGQLRMDDTVGNTTYSLNEAILHLNLAGLDRVKLSLDHLNNEDENHSLPSSFTGHADGDGIAFGADGTNWYRLADLTDSFTGQLFDLDAAVQSAGIAYTADFRIKFQQYDNYPAPTSPSDGRYFDNILVSVHIPTTIYVDMDATQGANDGSSWTNAFTSLQDALTASLTGDEIRVARGIYKPADAGGSRTSTFRLKTGVAVKGGYAGFGQPDPDTRDVNLYESILSGDLDGNDAPVADPCDLLTEPTRAENCYHVLVTGVGTNETTVLDGFTITAGNADGTSDPNDEYGGGLLNELNSSPTIIDCTFFANSAFQCGGGMASDVNSSPTVTNCTFSSNSADLGGGGMASDEESSSIVTNCTFSSNSADYGGGVLNFSSSPTLTNCTFSGNSATYGGGGMYDYHNSPIVTGCAFSGNLAGEDGGGMHMEGSTARLVNCTFSDNTAVNGNALACDSFDQLASSDVQVANCILWDGGNGIWNNDGSTITITYSDVQGSWPGEGNIDTDPCFVDPSAEDYHLMPGSPCIDAGDNSAVPAGITTDLDGKPRFSDDPSTNDTGKGTSPFVDMGAYEFQGIIGDFCGANSDQPDGYVDYWDLLYFAQRWHTSPSDTNWDPRCDLAKEDNYVDYWDLLVFAQQWHKGVKP